MTVRYQRWTIFIDESITLIVASANKNNATKKLELSEQYDTRFGKEGGT